MSVMQDIQRKSLYGRRDWLHWRDRAGQEHVAVRSADSIKAALLATGTKGDFRLVSRGVMQKVRWQMGLIMLRNARAGY
jgi:hypothetical protein